MEGLTTSQKRLTLGYLSFYQNLIMTGVLEAAERENANIISFNCNSNVDVADFNTEMDSLFALINRQHLDGLLFLGWMSVIGVNMDTFRAQFRELPLYSLGSGYPDIPNSSCDGSIFFREILTHLIDVHGCRRIALIEPIAVDSRVQIYTDLLKAIDAYDPDLVVRSAEVKNSGLDFEARAGAALAILLDDRRVEFDAVASFFNLEAVAVLTELKRRGYNVPDTIKVVGSEDKKPGRYSTPPLTTVYFPYREIGATGTEHFLKLLRSGQGKKPEVTVIPGRVVIRNSCGCVATTLKNTQEPILFPPDTAGGAAHESAAFGTALRERFPNLPLNAERIVRALLDDARQEQPNSFTAAFAEELDQYFTGRDDASPLEDFVSAMRWLVLAHSQGDIRLRLENLFHQARVVIQEQAAKAHGNSQIKIENLNATVQDVGKELLTTFDMERIFSLLEKKLPKIGVPGCHIFLAPTEEAGASQGDYQLVFNYNDNRRLPLEKTAARFPDDLPRTLFPRNRRYTLSGHILFINSRTLGFVFFEHGPADESLYASLAIQLATALNGALLVRRILTAEERLSARARTIDELVRPMIAQIQHLSSVVDEQSARIRELEESSRESNRRMQQTRTVVDAITQTLDRTKNLVVAINEISDTVDLVALNASIEAAHAGKFGIGFKVIAAEIRKLAENTKRKAGETADFLKSMNERIAEFVSVNTETAEVFRALETNIHLVIDSLGEVAEGMGSLSTGNQAILEVMDRSDGGGAHVRGEHDVPRSSTV
ncbi:MAG TPA: hypothetical protein ENN69_07025 [Spirochaetia bacterium]|nr:hypothetical protein [Spirochaetia bacterium]